MKVAIFDIEATSLEGSYGRLLCMGLKFLDEDKVRMVTARTLRQERAALLTIEKWFDEANIIVGWNSKMYDWAFIQQRRIVNNLPPMKKPMHIDLMWVHKYHFRSRGHSLLNVGKDLKCKANKFDVHASEWTKAMEGDQAALDLIVKHCVEDCKLTEEVYHKLVPYIKNIHI